MMSVRPLRRRIEAALGAVGSPAPVTRPDSGAGAASVLSGSTSGTPRVHFQAEAARAWEVTADARELVELRRLPVTVSSFRDDVG